jgi:hypothetical protein
MKAKGIEYYWGRIRQLETTGKLELTHSTPGSRIPKIIPTRGPPSQIIRILGIDLARTPGRKSRNSCSEILARDLGSILRLETILEKSANLPHQSAQVGPH